MCGRRKKHISMAIIWAKGDEYSNDKRDKILRFSVYIDVYVCVCASLIYFLSARCDNTFFTRNFPFLKSKRPVVAVDRTRVLTNSLLIMFTSYFLLWHLEIKVLLFELPLNRMKGFEFGILLYDNASCLWNKNLFSLKLRFPAID